ncbi:signal transduction histidine kinase [Agrobacterium vitis]|nr:signal transduction histidine kinase [Agrobacterium vitis]MBE1436541.1 signal transduction histidine kinase [Agrobacterium vitis]
MRFKVKFIQSSLLMMVSGIALLLAIVVSALVLINNTRHSFNTLVAERSIRSTAADLFSLLQDAESGQRGYLLTGNENFLAPYHDATAQVAASVNRLVTLTEDRPGYATLVAPIDGQVRAKLDEMASTIRLASAGDKDKAMQIVLHGFGQKLMNTLRTQIQAIIDLSDTNIQYNITRQISASDQMKWIMIGAAIAIMIIMGISILIVRQYIASINAASQKVQQFNVELETRVAERTEGLVRANQEVQRFAYIVTHDLRAPLVNIMGFTTELENSLTLMKKYVLADGAPLSDAEILQAREAAAEDVPEAIGFIRSSTEKMDGLINAILKISREGRRQLKPEMVDIRAIAENSVNSLKHLIDAADGEVDIWPSPLHAINDKLSLEQIFTNLVDNAIKYRSAERPLKITVTAKRTGSFIETVVEDNGRGISAADHERIFELFRRAGQQNQTGDGIGLAHVRSLARNLGGDINVRSELGKGSAFILTVPADLSVVLRRVGV